MRGNPKMMGLIYFGLAGLFIYLAILNVNTESWNIWVFAFAAIAAIDIMIGIRFFRSTPKRNSNN